MDFISAHWATLTPGDEGAPGVIAAVSVMSEGVFLAKLIERITEIGSSLLRLSILQKGRKSQRFGCLLAMDTEAEASFDEGNKGYGQPC